MKKISSGLFVLFAAVSLIAAQTPPPGAPAPAAGQEQQPSAAPAPAQEPAPLNQPAAPQPQTQPATETKPEAPMPQPPPPTSGAAAAAKPDSIPLPPFPSMRNAITTEKPIKGMPDGVIPRQKSAAGTAEPETVPKTTTEGGSSASPSPATAAATAPEGGKPVAADTSKVAIVPPKGSQPQPGAARSTQPPKKKTSDTYHEELSLFNAPTASLRTAKVVIDDEYNLAGMVYGDQLGFIHILEADENGDFTEIWKSPPLNSEVRGVFVENLDHTGEAEIVAYTLDGNIFIYGYDTRELKYKTPEGTYQGINCMIIANLDNSPELELLFITKAGKMVQFDPVTKFEEWVSTETYQATDMAYGNVDNDRNFELILNSGEIINYQFKSVKWKMDAAHISPNSRLYLIDIDKDGILELAVEYDRQYIRFFDLDQRREKW